jgi:hypothetical protein
MIGPAQPPATSIGASPWIRSLHYLASYTLGIFKLSFAKFGPTEIRILLGIANTVLFFLPAARLSG